MKRDLLKERRRETPPAAYAAVLALRRRGHRVEPMPGHPRRHVVDGEIIPTHWLIDLARGVDRATVQAPREP